MLAFESCPTHSAEGYSDAAEALREFSEAMPTAEVPPETMDALVTADPLCVYTKEP